MDINDFCQKVSTSEDFRLKSRLLIIPNNEDYLEVNGFLRDYSLIELVKVSDCIFSDCFLPAAAKLCSMLKEKIETANRNGHTALVIGLEAIIELWSLEQELSCMKILSDLLKDTNLHFFVYVRKWNDLRHGVFSKPIYKEGQFLLRVGENGESSNGIDKITLLSKDFLDAQVPGVCNQDFQTFVREYENGTLAEGDINIFVEFHGTPVASIDSGIDQVYSHEQFLKVFCEYNDNLSTDAVEWLYGKIKSPIKPALSFAQNFFFPAGINDSNVLEDAPAKIRNTDGPEREVLIWMLRKSVNPKSYLYCVLSNPQFDASCFSEFYVCEALNHLSSEEISDFSSERKKALEELGTKFISGELTTFIRLSKENNYPLEKIAPWLNLQTAMEKQELLRLHIQSGQAEVAACIKKSYPLLGKYLEPYKLGYIELNKYFTEYRKQKLTNLVSEEFCSAAANIDFSIHGIESRDALLKSYSSDNDTALLVVDALGAEYIPLLTALAQEQGLGIASVAVAWSKLPTSTEYNPISWPEQRRIPEIKALDDIIHNGAELHTSKSFEENFAALLNVFETKILIEITNAMSQFPQVILTSDHGATRLAVCAYQQKIAKTIPLKESVDVDDWRYTKIFPEYNANDDFIENLAGKHLVVKGYNRLPKRGGKLFEMHGGATYEECLVPFIVFRKGAVFTPQTQQTYSTDEQFVENDDFDL